MTLEAIIEGCKNKNNKSEATLVKEYAPTLLAICQRYCYERSLAHDALQETFINIFKYINSYSGKGSFEGWMKRIAVNSSIQLLKKYKPFDFKEDNHLEKVVEAQVPDVSSSMSVDEILSLINELPKSLALVFNLYIVEGYSHNEIGEMLNITSSTSRSHLTKARVKMIEKINAQNEVVESTYYNKI